MIAVMEAANGNPTPGVCNSKYIPAKMMRIKNPLTAGFKNIEIIDNEFKYFLYIKYIKFYSNLIIILL